MDCNHICVITNLIKSYTEIISNAHYIRNKLVHSWNSWLTNSYGNVLIFVVWASALVIIVDEFSHRTDDELQYNTCFCPINWNLINEWNKAVLLLKRKEIHPIRLFKLKCWFYFPCTWRFSSPHDEINSRSLWANRVVKDQKMIYQINLLIRTV